jgi:hypothetical protein
MKIKHPYIEYEGTLLWSLIDEAVDDLVINKDIELTTRKEYVIGYFCKMLHEKYEHLQENENLH